MTRRKKKENPGCQFCNRDGVKIKLLPLFDGRIAVPLCAACARFLRRRGHNLTKFFEDVVRQYATREPAFNPPEKEKQWTRPAC